MTVGGKKNSVTRYCGIAASNSCGSGLVMTTTAPPLAVQGIDSMPAVWVIGAAARFTGRILAGYGVLIMKCAKLVCTLRWVFMTPLGKPVVPPVGPSQITSSGSTATRGSVAGCCAMNCSSDSAPSTSPSMQTH
ncbi:hypothetical protein D9M71_596120 [compost metagenome]